MSESDTKQPFQRDSTRKKSIFASFLDFQPFQRDSTRKKSIFASFLDFRTQQPFQRDSTFKKRTFVCALTFRVSVAKGATSVSDAMRSSSSTLAPTPVYTNGRVRFCMGARPELENPKTLKKEAVW
jgi:hypothetical protein